MGKRIASVVAGWALGSVPVVAAEPPVDPTEAQGALVTFSAMGCGPYTPEDDAALAFYLGKENALPKARQSQFIVHLGDINSGAVAKLGLLDDAYYAKVRGFFVGENRIPTFFVPGDNEWNDRPDPAVGWASWEKHLMRIDEQWKHGWKVVRQRGRPENFAFQINGVTMVGVNFVGGRIHDAGEWRRRTADDLEWVRAQLLPAGRARRTPAAVVFCQANPTGLLAKPEAKEFGRAFIDGVADAARRFGKPVLLLHADGHRWIENIGWQDVPNLTRVQVDRVEPRFPPVQVRAVRQADGMVSFSFDRRLDDPGWRVPGDESGR